MCGIEGEPGRTATLDIHHPNVVGGAVTPGALVCDPVTRPVPDHRAVARFAVGQHDGIFSARRIQQEYLGEFATARVHGEDHLRAVGLALQSTDRFIVKSNLPSGPARVIDVMHLAHVSETGGNEDSLAVFGPVLEACGTHILVTIEVSDDGAWNLRHVLHHQVAVVRFGVVDLREGGCAEEDEREAGLTDRWSLHGLLRESLQN